MNLWKGLSVMGLDNGFLVCSDKRIVTRDMLPSRLIFPFERDDGAPEIIYWRKNWGLRDAVLDYISDRDAEDCYYQITTVDQVNGIMSIICDFMDKDIWETEGRSIWSYGQIKKVLKTNLHNLKVISKFMKNNPDIYLCFYDSY